MTAGKTDKRKAGITNKMTFPVIIKIKQITGIFLALQLTLGLCHAEDPVSRPKNIILMIGDGMGIAQIQAAMTVNKNKLNIERCTHSGFSKTHSASDYITDSGAGGTAIATGQKTKNESVAIDTNGRPLTTILEIAELEGKATGLVATSSIVHATPASFIAHVSNRNDYEQIALAFIKTEIDVFIGGGTRFFSSRKDKRNLIDELKTKGYTITYTVLAADSVKNGKLACLTAPEHNPSMIEGRGNYLTMATATAIRLLNQNPTGFFLMVEGSQIDWGGHEKNQEKVITETLDFDRAVGIALDFAAADSNTLVVITADHETGGMSIVDGNIKKGTVQTRFALNDHTGVMVPVFAYGPGAELFSAIYENTGIFEKMLLLQSKTK